MPSVLLTYATTHGHTAKVADHLAEALRAHGADVDLRDVEHAGEADLDAYDAVVAAASLHAGHHQRAIVNWLRVNRDKLTDRPTLFISVSLTAAEDTDEAREATQRCIDDLQEETGWRPSRSEPVAGALQYREYDVFTRVLMRLKMRQGGHPADPSQDHEYTDWAALRQLAEEFAAQLTGPNSASIGTSTRNHPASGVTSPNPSVVSVTSETLSASSKSLSRAPAVRWNPSDMCGT